MKTDHTSMKIGKAFINRETTTVDVDKWMDDLLIRIELRTMHPHDLIHQDGTTESENQCVAPAEISLSNLLGEDWA